jgi:hypothetical protein
MESEQEAGWYIFRKGEGEDETNFERAASGECQQKHMVVGSWRSEDPLNDVKQEAPHDTS